MGSLAEKITDSEYAIMQVIWEHGGRVPYSHIRNALSESNWAPDTIRTMVRRLHQKGVLDQTKDGIYFYTPVISREDYMSAKTEDLVGRVYGGNVKELMAALMHYDGVSEKELDELKKYWGKRHDNE